MKISRWSLSLVFLLVVFIAGLHGQTNQPNALAPTPANRWFGFGGVFDARNTPHMAAEANLGIGVASLGGLPTWSCSQLNFVPLRKPRGAIATSVTTGLCQDFLKTPFVDVIAIGQVGIITSQDATGGTFGGGAALVFKPIKRLANGRPYLKSMFNHSVQPADLSRHSGGLLWGPF